MNYNVANIFMNALQSMVVESESERIKIYRNLKFFYDNDLDEIESYLKDLLVKKKIYSVKTIEDAIIIHRDNIQKSLKRVTAGIFDNRPVRELVDKSGNVTDYDLTTYLDSINYNAKIKECFKKARYYGIAEMYISYVNGKIRLEVIVPDRYIVETKPEDYLEKERIYIQKSDGSELFYEVWTDKDYGILKSSIELDKKDSRAKLVDEQPNVYKKIPVIALRFNETDYYYPEPNWDLFTTQIELDIKRTGDFLTGLFQKFGVWTAVNLGLKDGQTVSPNQILKVDDVKEGDVLPTLECVVPQVDWKALADDINFTVLDSLRSQGINTNSASIETKAQSGTAKTIDEIELIEERESVKEQLYNFELEVLEMIRTIQNIEGEKIPDGEFEVTYSEEKSIETIDDKMKRREMEIKYGIKSPIDFIMEDFECSQEEALKIYNDNKEFNKPVEPIITNNNG